MRVLRSIIGCLFIYFLFPAGLHAGVAMDQVRATSDRVLAILNDPKFDGAAGKAKQLGELRQVIYPRFDFVEMSRRSLGSAWQKITADQQRDFVAVFTQLLEESYLSNIQGFKGEKVLYTSDSQENDFARVDTKIISKQGEQLTVNYSLHQAGDDWKVYDVVVENISIVNNYRAQLTRMLGQVSFSELLNRLREKVAASGKTAR